MSDIDILLKEQIDATRKLEIVMSEKLAILMDRIERLEKEVREIKAPGVLTYPSTSPTWLQSPIYVNKQTPTIDFDKITCTTKSEVNNE